MKMIRKFAQKAIVVAVTPPLFIAELTLRGALALGFGAMMLHQSLMTEEDWDEEMERRRQWIEKHGPYRGV